MEENVYKILGIVQARLEELTPEEADKAIKQKYKRKLDVLIEEIHGILNDKFTATEKLEKIEPKIQDFLKFACAFSRIEKYEDRSRNGNMNVQSIEEEVRGLKQSLARSLRFSEPAASSAQSQNSPENSPVQKTRVSNAYQALAISENEELSDQKVAIKTVTFLKMVVSKKAPFKVTEAERMLFKALKYVWAYSKLDTPEKRKEYAGTIQKLQLLSNEKVRRAITEVQGEELEPDEINNPQTVAIELDEKGEESLEISEVQRLVATNFLGATTAVNQYEVKRNNKGKITGELIYSCIDMERLQTDPTYQEKVKELLDDTRVKISNRYMGGYVGQVIDEEDALNIRHLPKHIAMCIENRKRQQSVDTPSSPPQDPGAR